MAASFCGNSTFWNETTIFDNWYPEFSRCFQQTALTFIPCGWLWLTGIVHVIYLHKHTQVLSLPTTWLSVVRLLFPVALCLLSGLHMLVPLDDGAGESSPPSYYVSQSVWATTFFLVCVLMVLSQRAGVPSPCVVFIFWTLALVVHIVPVYVSALEQEYEDNLVNYSLVCVTFGLIVVEFGLQCAGDTKVFLLEPTVNEKPCPMIKSSFISRLTFSWVFRLVYVGYKKVVELSDIYALPPLMQCRHVVPDFLVSWAKELKRKNFNLKAKQTVLNTYKTGALSYTNGSYKKKTLGELEPTEKTRLLPQSSSVNTDGDDDVSVERKKPSLYRALADVFYLPLLKAQLVGLVGDLLVFLNPVLLDQIIMYVESKDSYPRWQGFVLAGSFFVVMFLNSMTNNYRMYHSMNIGIQVKTALTAAVYKKSLTMNAESRRQFTVGTIVNLMSVDCTTFQDLTFQLYALVSWPVQISLAFYMLYDTIGIAFVAGIVVLLTLLPTNARLSTLTRRAQAKQITFKDQRIRLLNEILSGVKVLKLYAWEPSFQAKITEIRNKEVVQLKKAAIYQSINTLCWLLSPVLVTVASFIAYVLITQDSLTPSKAFVALNLFNTIRQPMNTLPNLIALMVQCQVSMTRLRNYLSGEDLEEPNSAESSEEFPMVMKNATYTWDRTMEPVLRNITMRIPKGKLVAIVGQVGSGKSSLLSAFLGEMEKKRGQGSMQGSVAYVPQQAWIQNLTFRANILFEKPMNEKQYRKVIKACALEPDLELLAGGEMTEIGEKGINLSGGQKQRISLARAVYQDSDVYLLDDPLSAVDAHVGKHIFERVIGPKGIINKKTRVLVTHGLHWMPQVDMIFVMDQGRITESGTYQQLMTHDGPFAQFVRTYLVENDDDMDDPEVQQIKDQMMEHVGAVTSDEEYQQVRLRRSISDQRGARKMSQVSVRSSVSATEVPTKYSLKDKPESNQRLIEEEKAEKGKVRIAVFLAMLKAFGYFLASLVPVSVLAYNGFNVFSGIWLSDWTDDPYLRNESNAGTDEYTSTTYMYLGVYTALSLLQVAGNAVFVLLVYVQFINASRRLHNGMLHTIMHQPMSFFDTTPLGRILNRFSRDVDVLDRNMAQQVRLVLQTLFNIVSVVVVISYTTPIFLAVVVPIFVVYVLFQKFYIPSSRQFRRIESITRSPIFSHFAETISGASSIRAYRVDDRFFLDSQNLVDTNNKCNFAAQSAARWLRVRLEIMGNLIVLFAGLFAVLSEDITGSLVGLSVSYALQVTNSLNMMVQNMTQLETNSVSVERIVEYSKLPQEPEWVNIDQRPAPGWPLNGKIEFDRYSTRYRPQLDLVLKSISFSVKDGEKIGIVGRTGAGKSSLSLALFRVIEAAEGRILIDGLDISTIGLHDLRSRLTILPQDPVLFSGSVRFNLDPFDIHSDDEIWEALENAHLSDFVRDLPEQLEHICEEGGQNLSVGQRQLMCLARSLLRKTKILILDEATAAVDLETDFLLQNTIREAFKECTVLTVAHRLKTVIDYDRILVLSNGEIVEFGSPEALLGDKSGIFYSMAKESGIV